MGDLAINWRVWEKNEPPQLWLEGKEQGTEVKGAEVGPCRGLAHWGPPDAVTAVPPPCGIYRGCRKGSLIPKFQSEQESSRKHLFPPENLSLSRECGGGVGSTVELEPPEKVCEAMGELPEPLETALPACRAGETETG